MSGQQIIHGILVQQDVVHSGSPGVLRFKAVQISKLERLLCPLYFLLYSLKKKNVLNKTALAK